MMYNKVMRILWELFKNFFKIGIMTFGGGLAMLPLMEKYLVDETGWCQKQDLVDYYAISQCTPGVIAVNVATLVGYRKKGILGALLATLGVITPSIIIIIIIAQLLSPFMKYHIVKAFFKGVKIGVCALIGISLYKLFKSNINDLTKLMFMLMSSVLLVFFNISPILILIVVSVSLGIYEVIKHA